MCDLINRVTSRSSSRSRRPPFRHFDGHNIVRPCCRSECAAARSPHVDALVMPARELFAQMKAWFAEVSSVRIDRESSCRFASTVDALVFTNQASSLSCSSMSCDSKNFATNHNKRDPRGVLCGTCGCVSGAIGSQSFVEDSQPQIMKQLWLFPKLWQGELSTPAENPAMSTPRTGYNARI